MLLGGEAEIVDDQLDVVFGGLDALGNLDFLFAREQRHLAHLLQVHAHRVIEDVEAGIDFGGLLFLFGLALETVHLRGVNDLDIHPAEHDEDRVEFVRGKYVLRQNVVYVAIGQVALLLGELDQLLDLLVFLVAIELRWFENDGFLPVMIILRHKINQ